MTHASAFLGRPATPDFDLWTVRPSGRRKAHSEPVSGMPRGSDRPRLPAAVTSMGGPPRRSGALWTDLGGGYLVLRFGQIWSSIANGEGCLAWIDCLAWIILEARDEPREGAAPFR